MKQSVTIRGIVAAVLAALLLPVSAADPVAAQSSTESTITFEGRGWGHGRGLGQYGAYGYATEHGWSSAQILDHFYGNTVAGQAADVASVDTSNVRIYLHSQQGTTTVVGRDTGAFELRDAAGQPLVNLTPAEGDAPQPFGPWTGAVRLAIVPDGFSVQVAPTCAGPFTEIGRAAGDQIDVIPSGGGSLLHHCRSNGTTRRYAGSLRAVDAGGPRTVNVTSIEEYLRGVVPQEVPASWPAAALEAQAVAARSYALAGDSRWASGGVTYADTCDTIYCQVYGGVDASHPGTDAAIAATAGLVRVFESTGRIARTEFSSSTGGWTVEGDFPAVEDLGDSTTANPNRNWTITVGLTQIESAYGLGPLLSVDVTERSGLGPDGGRVETVALRFRDGTRTMSGNDARRLFGLKSDWFTPGPVERAGDIVRGEAVDAMYELFVGSAPSESERQQLVDRLSDTGDDREALALELAQSEAWAGRMIDDLYRKALGRPSDADGRAYWLAQLARDDVRFADVGVWFFGSEEYRNRAGGTDDAFVAALYRDLLFRDSDPGGRAYWLEAMEDGAGLDDVAFGFWMSLESRRDRARVVADQVLGREPTADELDVWAGLVRDLGDTGLAARLAASEEFLVAATS